MVLAFFLNLKKEAQGKIMTSIMLKDFISIRI